MNWLGSLQQLGRAIMLPTMVLPAAAILLSLGSLPWSAWGLSSVSEVATYAGQGIFYFMPYLFAVGVAWGLSNQAGTAGLAALAGMFTYDRIVTHMGDGLVQPATLIGILLGIVAGIAQNRFKNIKLPEAIQFFGGSRFVLLFMGLFSAGFAWVMLGISPLLQRGLDDLFQGILQTGGFGVFIYGVLYRVLTAFGLHHILNNVFWFQFGNFTTPDGSTVVQGICHVFLQAILRRAFLWRVCFRL